MPKPLKLRKSQREIERNFRDLFNGLVLSSKSYDEGFQGEAARLANSVYILIHDRGRKTQSLLTQLGRTDIEFVNTANPLIPDNLAPETKLTFIRISKDDAGHVAKLGESSRPIHEPSLSLKKWWEFEVMRDTKRRTLSRKKIVSHLRNGEGGGHVDPTINEVFSEIQTSGSMGWVFTNSHGVIQQDYGPEYATMRQIAWEVEQTLRQHCSDLLPP